MGRGPCYGGPGRAGETVAIREARRAAGVGAGGSADLGEGREGDGDYGRNGESIVPWASRVYGDGVSLRSGGCGCGGGWEEETGVGSGFHGLGRGLYRSLTGLGVCLARQREF